MFQLDVSLREQPVKLEVISAAPQRCDECADGASLYTEALPVPRTQFGLVDMLRLENNVVSQLEITNEGSSWWSPFPEHAPLRDP